MDNERKVAERVIGFFDEEGIVRKTSSLELPAKPTPKTSPQSTQKTTNTTNK
ncbi:unnamed protein product [marine sediment metagenome]|uniref:Uncharacterized protein n=1 Tax=marine sediment metagenome TaxID=412755 RepID=X1BJ43_9ZZZZ